MVFSCSQTHGGYAHSPKPCQKPKILVSPRDIFSVNDREGERVGPGVRQGYGGQVKISSSSPTISRRSGDKYVRLPRRDKPGEDFP